MALLWQLFGSKIKDGILTILMFLSLFVIASCSTNPATGARQFTALMSEKQEERVGAEEHQKILKQYDLYDDDALAVYVSAIGDRVTKRSERSDVVYKFYVLDSPIVNAFALPGGYIYISRGLLALANNEAEVAGVLGHEAGHITARHSAERYSHSVVSSLGTTILSTVIGNSAVSQVLGTGKDLYLSGYSRTQEHEADTLGIRYLSHGGYDLGAMSSFLDSMQRFDVIGQDEKNKGARVSYFSTHPPTADRVSKTKNEAGQVHAHTGHSRGVEGRDVYLDQIRGMVYGDSASQGFQRKSMFYHPAMGFKFQIPKGFLLANLSDRIAMTHDKSGAISLFDFKTTKHAEAKDNAEIFLRDVWMDGAKGLKDVEIVNIGGREAATAHFKGKINKKSMNIRIVAIKWESGRYARFQIGIPGEISKDVLDELKSHSYSLASMSEEEKRRIKPSRIKVITASEGDTVETMAKRQIFTEDVVESFRVLNGLEKDEALVAGRRYKIVSY